MLKHVLTIILSLFLIVEAFAADVKISWDAVTHYDNGKEITDPITYQIYSDKGVLLASTSELTHTLTEQNNKGCITATSKVILESDAILGCWNAIDPIDLNVPGSIKSLRIEIISGD